MGEYITVSPMKKLEKLRIEDNLEKYIYPESHHTLG